MIKSTGKRIFEILLVTVVFQPFFASLAVAQQDNWVGSWATSEQVPEPQNALAPSDLTDATLRQIVHLSIGGKTLRIHLSNAFGTSALHLTSVHVARPISPASSAIDPASDKALQFSGSPDVLIPPGAQYISDPIDYPSAPLSDIAITFHLDSPPSQQTGHPGSRATTYIAQGDVVSQTELTGAKTVEHWYVIAGIDVSAPPATFSVVALGDSITDGHAATTNGNDRWTDVLARTLQANPSTRNIAVLNHGIGGNHLLTDGLGPNVLARFDRDVLAQAGVRYVIVLEGINDLGSLARLPTATEDQHAALVHRMIGAYQQIIARAHAEHIKLIGATILPDGGSGYYHPGTADDSDRQQVNQWIRAAGHFDAVVDLDKIMADPQDPTRMRPAYDSGDHLHPSPVGYKVMGEAFPASLFTK
jgi:lysophospholipase L1-like esterase